MYIFYTHHTLLGALTEEHTHNIHTLVLTCQPYEQVCLKLVYPVQTKLPQFSNSMVIFKVNII